MKQIILFFTSLSISIGLYSQIVTPSSNQNYILTKTYTEADGSKSLDKINYFDGLGRPIQEIQRGINPEGKDLILIQEYDAYGREYRQWLPVYSGGNDATFRGIQSVKDKAKKDYNDARPLSEAVYENSPLNRVAEQYGAGNAWYTNKKSVKTEYFTNDLTTATLKCAKITASTDYNVTLNSNNGNFYNKGELFVTKTTDEDGNASYEFKNKLEQVILTRQVNNKVNYDTHYIYDDFGNLRAVLPPMASDTVYQKAEQLQGGSYTRLHLAYLYAYDSRNRCTEKKLPSCDWASYVYDKADRLVFSRDGEQAKKKQWTYYKYDDFGRMIITGLYNGADSRATLANLCANIVVKESKTTASTTNYGYTWNILSAKMPPEHVITANYYDNYQPMYNYINTINGRFEGWLKYWEDSNYDKGYLAAAKGLQTGTLSRYLQPNGWLSRRDSVIISTFHYDQRARLIQTRKYNHIGGLEVERVQYNFTGQPLKKKNSHVRVAGESNTQVDEFYRYSYDHAGRLLETKHAIAAANVTIKPTDTTVLAKNTYDELGRLKTSIANNQANLETKYSYNIRSWITKIENNLFTEDLYYEQQITGHANSKSKAYYNGNISVMEWSSKIGSDYEKKMRSYWYYYDNLSRLTSTSYRENVATGDRVENNRFQTAYTYDKQGNIKTLIKRGLRAGGDAFDYIDRLTVTSSVGNQIMAVSDAGKDSYANTSYDFKDRNTEGDDYAYNQNGAMTMDLNKGIKKIEYNLLNTPRRVDIVHKQAEARNEYTYSADGQKLRVVNKWNPVYSTNPLKDYQVNAASLTKTKRTDYVGNFIYENGNLDRVLIEGGYRTGGKYYFYVRDHLGNNRVVADASGNVIQRTHYYPFGAPFNESTGQDVQAYKFGGKEFDTMHGLNQYDVEARQQDPTLGGRFTSVDPHAENYYSWSPYVYCGNNPIRNIDPDGRDYWSTSDPNEIAKFVNAMGNRASQFDFSSNWEYATNEEFTSKLTYNDDKSIAIFTRGYEEDGAAGIKASVFSTNLTPVSFDGTGYPGAYVYQYGGNSNLYYQSYNLVTDFSFAGLFAPFDPTRYNDGWTNWRVNSSGRITGIAPTIGFPPGVGKGGGRGGKFGGKTGRKSNPNRVDSWVQKIEQLQEQLKNATTKTEKAAIQDKIKHARLKQKASEPHGRKGQGY